MSRRSRAFGAALLALAVCGPAAMAQGAPPLGGPAPAPPPAASDDAALSAFILGTWRVEMDMSQPGQPVRVTIDITYLADQSFIGTQTFAGTPGVTPTVVNIAGRWTLRATGPQHFILTLDYGAATSGLVRAETVRVKVIDQNTVQNEADGSLSRRIR